MSTSDELDHYLLRESEKDARTLFGEHGQIADPICIAWKGKSRAALIVLPWSKEPEAKTRVMAMLRHFVAVHEITAVTFVLEAWVRKYATIPEGRPAPAAAPTGPLTVGSSILIVSVCQKGRPALGAGIPIAEDRTLDSQSQLTTTKGFTVTGWFADFFGSDPAGSNPPPPDPSRN